MVTSTSTPGSMLQRDEARVSESAAGLFQFQRGGRGGRKAGVRLEKWKHQGGGDACKRALHALFTLGPGRQGGAGGGDLMDVICLTTSAGACMSMRRLWIFISKQSQVLVPSPQGDLRVVMRRRLVGMRTGPFTLRFFSLEPLMRSAHTVAERRARPQNIGG